MNNFLITLVFFPLTLMSTSFFNPHDQSPASENCIPVSHHADWKTVPVKEGNFKMQLPSNYSGGIKNAEGEKVFSVSRADHTVSFSSPMGKLNSYSTGCLPAKAPDTIYIHFGGPMGREAMLPGKIQFCDNRKMVVGIFYHTVDSQFGRLFWLDKNQFEPVLDATFDSSSLQEIISVFATTSK